MESLGRLTTFLCVPLGSLTNGSTHTVKPPGPLSPVVDDGNGRASHSPSCPCQSLARTDGPRGQPVGSVSLQHRCLSFRNDYQGASRYGRILARLALLQGRRIGGWGPTGPGSQSYHLQDTWERCSSLTRYGRAAACSQWLCYDHNQQPLMSLCLPHRRSAVLSPS